MDRRGVGLSDRVGFNPGVDATAQDICTVLDAVDSKVVLFGASEGGPWLRELISSWGGPSGIETFAPTISNDAQARSWWAGLLRASSSPGAINRLLAALQDTDVSDLLIRNTAPTLVLHRCGDRAVRIDAGRYLASKIAQSRSVELDGADHWPFAGEQQPMLNIIREFISKLET